MKQTIVWNRLDFTSVEHLTFSDSGEGKSVISYITGATENQPFAVQYQIEIADNWTVSSFKIHSLDNEKSIRMTSDNQGKWFDASGVHLAEFDGCFDIDITLTPFTNTLLIKRLSFETGEQKQFTVLYIELPEFNIKRVEQFYTKIGERLYVYEGYPKDFRAELPLDEMGFVTNYPEIFQRIYPIN